MRSEEEVRRHYNNYLKFFARTNSNYWYGAACALGFTLGKTFPEIEADLNKANKKFKNS